MYVLVDDYQNEMYYKTVVALDDKGLHVVNVKRHRVGRYEYETSLIPLNSISSVRIRKKIFISDIFKGLLVAFMGYLFIMLVIIGMDWGYKVYVIAPLAIIVGIATVFTSRKTAAFFYGRRRYLFIARGGMTADRANALIKSWCEQYQIEIVDELAE